MPIFIRVLTRNLHLQLENFFNNVIAKNKCEAVAATAAVILGGICIGWAYAKRSSKHRKEVDVVFTRSMSLGALHGGKLALERVVAYHRARADAAASLDAADIELQDLLTEEHPDFQKLQSAIAKVEMSGKEAVAVGILESALKRARKDRKLHEAYEIEMLLVEMLIYKGDFQRALACECLTHEAISDARRPLYKALIHIMLDHPREEALKCWEEFKDIRIRFQSPPSSLQNQLNKVITNFNEFEKVVKLLKSDIYAAKTKKTTN